MRKEGCHVMGDVDKGLNEEGGLPWVMWTRD